MFWYEQGYLHEFIWSLGFGCIQLKFSIRVSHYLINPSGPNSGRREKSNLNCYFDINS